MSVSSDITHLMHYAHIPKTGLYAHKYHLSPCCTLYLTVAQNIIFIAMIAYEHIIIYSTDTYYLPLKSPCAYVLSCWLPGTPTPKLVYVLIRCKLSGVFQLAGSLKSFHNEL